jgi:NADH-quinone oxidoreductase subunit J
MSFSDWITDARNIVFLVIALAMAGASLVVVTTRNVVHAALTLVIALGGSAALFLMLGAEFVAWTVILVYIGAVIVLFLFGIMITRAPIGRDSVRLDHTRRWPAALIALSVFALMAWSTTLAFGSLEIPDGVVRASTLGDLLFSRYVIPFEAVSFVLLAALIGGIVLARKDPDR